MTHQQLATNETLLDVRDLKMHFPSRKGFFNRLVGHVKEGETLSLVGESGCGKTTTGRCIVRIYDPTDGSIQFRTRDNGKANGSVDLAALTRKAFKPFRKEIQSDELFTNSLHPYTEALLADVPKLDPRLRSKRIVLRGEIADPANPPTGCYFHPRCPYAQENCKVDPPPLREVKPGHWAACHYSEVLNLRGVALPGGT